MGLLGRRRPWFGHVYVIEDFHETTAPARPDTKGFYAREPIFESASTTLS